MIGLRSSPPSSSERSGPPSSEPNQRSALRPEPAHPRRSRQVPVRPVQPACDGPPASADRPAVPGARRRHSWALATSPPAPANALLTWGDQGDSNPRPSGPQPGSGHPSRHVPTADRSLCLRAALGRTQDGHRSPNTAEGGVVAPLLPGSMPPEASGCATSAWSRTRRARASSTSSGSRAIRSPGPASTAAWWQADRVTVRMQTGRRRSQLLSSILKKLSCLLARMVYFCCKT
jgi:hypothetical protein